MAAVAAVFQQLHSVLSSYTIILVVVGLILFRFGLYTISRILRTTFFPDRDSQNTLPCLQRRPYLFGVDTLLQDIADLRQSNSSNRAFLRHAELGTTYISTVLGRSTIHTIDTAHILSVTTNKFEDYEKDDWAQVIARYMGNGVLVNDGEAWHASRSMLKPLFKRNRSADFEMFAEHVDGLIEYLETNTGRFVDFRRAIQLLVLDITTHILCTEPTKSLPNALANSRKAVAAPNASEQILLDLIDGIEPYGNIAIQLGPLSLFVFVWQYRRIMQLVRGLQRFFRTAVHAAIRVGKEKKEQTAIQDESIIMQMLRQGLTTADAQGELQNIFFAAFDTTTALLTNLFDCIARHPEVPSQLKEDIANSMMGETTKATDISRSIYLRATIMETLRLCSPITYHTRKARVDTVLPKAGGGSLRVPKGTSVVWSTYTLNRQQEVCGGQDWADFRPERWLEMHPETGARQLITRPGFIPFGSGLRNCLGQQFAQSLTAYITARLVLAFDGLEHQHPSSAFQEAIAVTYYNKQGTNIRFSRGST